MKFLLSILAALTLCAPAQAQQTKAQLNSEVSTNFPDNTTGLITPAILRTTVNDFITSWQQAPRVNAQTGTTYAFVAADYGYLVTFSNVSATAVSLPQATTTFATFNVMACNRGAGDVTITPATSTINGAATLVLKQNQCTTIVADGTNYQILSGYVQPITCAAHNWVSTISAAGVPSCTQPAFSDVSSTIAAAQVGTATITGQTVNNSPNTSNDYFLYFSAADGAIRKCTVGACTSAGSSGVTSLNGLTGSLTAAAGTGIGVSAVGTTVTISNTGVTSAHVAAGTGIAVSGTCTITTTGTCTVALDGSINNGARVDNNGVSIVYAQPSPNNYVRYSPSTARFNQGSYWASFQLTPPSGARLVHLDAQIWISAGAAASGNYVAKWVKNFTVDGSGFELTGTDVCTGIGAIAGGTPGLAVMRASCEDAPTGTDYYGLFVFVDANGGAGNLVTIDGNAAHSFISMNVMRF